MESLAILTIILALLIIGIIMNEVFSEKENSYDRIVDMIIRDVRERKEGPEELE